MKALINKISILTAVIIITAMNVANAQHLKITSFIFPDTARVSQSYNNIQISVKNIDSLHNFLGTISIELKDSTTSDVLILYTDTVQISLHYNDSVTYSINGYHFITPHPYMAGHDVIIVWPVADVAALIDTMRDSVYIIDDTGIPTILNEKGIFIYPNPVGENLNYLINLPSNDINYVRIIDMLGAEVYRINKNKTTVPVNNLPSGMYFIEIRLMDGNAIREKFIKD